MSFFQKDYSAYPQPVVVTPDPAYTGGAISEAVADAIADDHLLNRSNAQASTGTTSTQDKELKDGDAQKEAFAGSSEDMFNERTTAYGEDLQQQQQGTKDASDKLSDGIMSLLGPIVQEMDFNIVAVRKSQTELEKEVERLMAELQLFMASSAAPPEVEPAVQKLVKARRQIMTANSTLKSVQDRVDRMHLQIEKRH
ncbi:hypothetical protein BX616_008562 [Lobosporangium transversale]|uniref:Biogenesis of lysosome-related organelles complex 1 subunit 7 n=1 Tax=Lobosporangium transversale TaxID=64571 RepID=A0A1Y2GQ98_9FUNG|nr:Snapin/Pallidin-domain-containing protein [Lobosporangium transversale]KAF9914307.1 hypothetical protein BX616_008562 [Lobosporangium transversale]ORZ19079.1 Snapin/Pallidin-domain-containing protein [Lobosporangium transversale]|eukprot:XP_021882247.1 Snapin/Pallidin-domain-containing protein [Lobosporangium transversale]